MKQSCSDGRLEKPSHFPSPLRLCRRLELGRRGCYSPESRVMNISGLGGGGGGGRGARGEFHINEGVQGEQTTRTFGDVGLLNAHVEKVVVGLCPAHVLVYSFFLARATFKADFMAVDMK